MSLRIRRGSEASPPPPPTEVFGPVAGAQNVRDGAAPQPVTDPGGGIPFSPSSNINSLLTANPSNTIFVASQTGTYTNFRNVDYSGKHPRFYFPGDALTDYNITGAGTLNEIGMNSSGGGIEIYGGKWTGYGSAASASFSCPILVRGGGPSIIRDAFFTLNAQKGLGLASVTEGDPFLVHRCKFLSNGRYHITGGAQVVGQIHLAPTIDSCLFDNANTSGFDSGDDAGCMKFNTTDGGIIRNCWSKNNKGFGLWFDGQNRNAHWHDNVVENNIGTGTQTHGGIFYEISGGGTVIEHNYITGNGVTTNANYPFNAVQLIISCSPCDGTGETGAQSNVRGEIRYNDIDTVGFQSPIVLYNHTSHLDVNRTRNWYAHHNRTWQRGSSGQSRVGLADACAVGSAKEGDIGTSPNSPGLCLFDYNEYHVADVSGAYWNHDTSSSFPGARTWAQWQARGHDANGTVTVI